MLSGSSLSGVQTSKTGFAPHERIIYMDARYQIPPSENETLWDTHDVREPQLPMTPEDASHLRVALFSGNYNYVRDGANQALNRLVEYLLRRGIAVRVYSPTSDKPAFEPQGDLVSLPSMPALLGRGEYRMAWPIPASVRRDIAAFRPNLVHISVPLLLGPTALRLARSMKIPAVASMHTRFETYLRYYGLGFLEPGITALLRRFYRGCDAVVAPSESAAQIMLDQGMADKIGIWTRGIDTNIFNPAGRNLEWRRSRGIGDQQVVIGFLGRLVMEKGLDIVAQTLVRLRRSNVPHRTLVIGDGPARGWFEEHIPDAIFCGHMQGEELGCAVASADILFNPSVTESFGNVTLEAMACGLPVVAARSTGSANLVSDGTTGLLVEPGAIDGFETALQFYVEDAGARQAHGRAALKASMAYDWDQVNEAMVRTYLDIVATPR
jgi:phosphatidylinositol alpha 1,6-mannosyltransferase